MTEGVQVGSRYRAIDMIGRGSFGTVFRGVGPEGPVAVKLLRPDLATDPDTVDRFLRERSLLLRLGHPNLVKVRDLVAESDLLALVMDLIEGPDLRTYVARQGALAAAQAADLVAGVADGLSHTHSAGIVHRDLKPENVLLRLADAGPVPLLTDFGIARLASGSSPTAARTVLGTPGYLAPELARGERATPSVDVYACGVLLYELVSGSLPFEGEHALAVIHRQLTESPSRPDRMPEQLWQLVASCLSADPADRPAAPELAGALRGRPYAAERAHGRVARGWVSQGRQRTSVLPVTGQPPPGDSGAPHPPAAQREARAMAGGWPLRIATLLVVAVLGVAGGYLLRLTTTAHHAAASGTPPGTPGRTPSPRPTAVRKYVADMPYTQVGNGWGPVERNHSVGGQDPDDGGAMVLGDTTYRHGLGTNSPSQVRLYPDGSCTSFTAMIGIDAAAAAVPGGTVDFQVVGDGKALYDSGVVTWESPPKPVQVDVTGVQVLDLVVGDGGDGSANDNADWADASLVCGT